ncbi:NUDIX domain-containing protein [Candidatus Parcubacteria bacterium]|nr:NUDIX domain-containing protein [Candidatus Parcubacteria bacterium]
METERPKVGLGVIIEKEGKILLGERFFGHGAGNWMIPGGHVEFGETFGATALREAAEECGLTDLELVGLVSVYNERDYGKHYVNLGILTKWRSGEPFAPEPKKSGNWHWHDPDDLPEQMFLASRKCVENWRAGHMCSDSIA